MRSEMLMATMPLAARPVVVSVAPTHGSAAGGTNVVVRVNDSTGATGASFGGVPLTGFAIVDATHVSGTTGAHAAGAVDVTVTNAAGTSAPLVGGYTYDVAITVTSIDARYSDTAGGKTRRIVGTGFTGATAADVLFGATPATSIVVIDDDNIDAVVPAHAAASVVVSVFGVALAGSFTFWNLTVPATPTLEFNRGNYTAGNWPKKSGSLTASFVTSSGGVPVVDAEGVPLLNLTTENLILSPSQGWEALIDSSSTNDCTIAFILEIVRLNSDETGLEYTGDQIVGDNNYRGHLGAVYGHTGAPNYLRWYWYEGAYRKIEIAIPFVGVILNPGVVFTSNGGTGDTIALGGSLSWAAMGFAVGHTITIAKPGATNNGKTGTFTALAGTTATLTSNIVTDLTGATGWTIRVPSTARVVGLLKRSTLAGVTHWQFSIDGGATWTARNAGSQTAGTTAPSGPVFLGYTAESEFNGRPRAIAFYKAMSFTAQNGTDFKGWADAEYL